MIPYERQRKILEYANAHDLVLLEDLLGLIPDASESTLRRDIKALEEARQVERLSGGAIKAHANTSELPSVTKATLFTKEKTRIAKLAAREIKRDETIYIDSGSTCTALLREALDMDVCIVTTNTDAIRTVSQPTRAKIVIAGGSYNPQIASLFGPLAEESLRRYIFDKAFLGANGVDLKFGITTPRIEESAKKRVVAEQSKGIFVLVDSSKFHRVANTRCIALEDTAIISDSNDERIAKRTTLIWQ